MIPGHQGLSTIEIQIVDAVGVQCVEQVVVFGGLDSGLYLTAQFYLIFDPGAAVVTAAHDAFEIADVVTVIIQISHAKFHRVPVGLQVIGAPTG